MLYWNLHLIFFHLTLLQYQCIYIVCIVYSSSIRVWNITKFRIWRKCIISDTIIKWTQIHFIFEKHFYKTYKKLSTLYYFFLKKDEDSNNKINDTKSEKELHFIHYTNSNFITNDCLYLRTLKWTSAVV